MLHGRTNARGGLAALALNAPVSIYSVLSRVFGPLPCLVDRHLEEPLHVLRKPTRVVHAATTPEQDDDKSFGQFKMKFRVLYHHC